MGWMKSTLSMGMKTMDIAQPLITYNDNRNSGGGVVSSIAMAAGELALWTVAPQAMALKMAYDVGSAVLGGAHEVGKTGAKTSSKAYKAGFGGYFKDTQNAYTMRQRGIQAIQNNGMNARSVLGGEARQYYRGGK